MWLQFAWPKQAGLGCVLQGIGSEAPEWGLDVKQEVTLVVGSVEDV